MKFREYLDKNKFLYLLIALLFFFIGNAFLVDVEIRYLFHVLFSVMVILSLFSLRDVKRPLIISSVILGVSVISLMLAGGTTNFQSSALINITQFILAILFFLIITFTALRYTLHDQTVTASTIYGAISTYLLMGLTWAHGYMLIDLLSVDAFLSPASQAYEHRFLDFIYYSFVTLTTLGYGDVIPLSNVAKTFSWLEAVVGQIYLTVLIAQLISQYVNRQSKKES